MKKHFIQLKNNRWIYESLEINIKNVGILLIFNLIIFQNPLMSVNRAFRTVDELLFFLCLLYICIRSMKTKFIEKSLMNMIIILWLITGLAVISSISSDVDRTVNMVLTDIVYFTKDFICFMGAYTYFKDNKIDKSSLKIFIAEIKMIVLIAFICMLVSLFVDIGMSGGVRYGIRAFKFIYSSAGMWSQYCILFLLILTFDLQNSLFTRGKLLFLTMLLIVWGASLRSRAFAIIAVWMVLMLVGRKVEDCDVSSYQVQVTFKRFFHSGYLILTGIVVLIMGTAQIQTYFGENTVSSRKLLLTTGLSIMKDYFPLGSGMGTFGTEIASTYYSPLYVRYGLNRFWALAEGGSELTDCYWPAILAEFGFFGGVLFVVLILHFFWLFMNSTKGKKYYEIACITYIVYILISSIATGILASYITAGFLVICMAMMNCEPETEDTEMAE